jgi:hypothetical protein
MLKRKVLLLSTVLASNASTPVVDPEITVTGNGQSIADGDNTPSSGDHTNFGLSASLSVISRTFNIAVAVSNLTGVSVALSGSGAGGFTITAQPSGSINAGANSNFTIRYDALTPIAYSATVTISSNELDDFTFAIQGSSLYSARVLANANLQRYNQLNEGSGLVLLDSGPSGYAGSAVGITWDAGQSPPMSGSVPNLDGANDYLNLYSVQYAADFDFDEGFVILWLKVNAGSVWTDGASRTLLSIRRDSSNRIIITKSSANNRVDFTRVANGTTHTITVTDFNQTGWISIALRWTVSGNALMAYRSGVQIGATQTGLVAAVGSGLDSTRTLIGASITTPTTVWNGYFRDFIELSSPDLGLMAV